MAIDKNAIVVLAMALGDGVQFSGALGTPAWIGAGIAIRRIIAAESKRIAVHRRGNGGGFNHGNDSSRASDLRFLHFIVAPVAVRMDMLDVRAVTTVVARCFRLVACDGGAIEGAIF